MHRDFAGLFSTQQLSRESVFQLFDLTTQNREKFSSKALEGCRGVLAFFEPSTRTKLSFQAAGLDLGLQWMDLKIEDLSLKKGESLKDTFQTIALYRPDLMVVRHAWTNVPALAAAWTQKIVINAGDGMNEHPTQALGDAFTITEHFGKKKIRLAFFGDVYRSRVARSNLSLLRTLGHDVVCVEDESKETDLFCRAFKVKRISRSSLSKMDVVMALRFQKERGSSVFKSGALAPEDLGAKAFLMHPGPVIVNEDIRADTLEALGSRNWISKQAENAYFIRRALLLSLLSKSKKGLSR